MAPSLKRKLRDNKTIKCPFAINWVIPKFLIEEMTGDEEFLVTPVYAAPNIPSVSYQLRLHPAKHLMGNICAVTFYFLVSVGNENEVYGTYTAEIKSADYCQSYRFNYLSTDTQARGNFIGPRNALLNPENQFFVNDGLLLQVSGILQVYRRDMVIQEVDCKKCKKQKNTESLGDCFWFDDGHDFTLIVGGMEIWAHKSLISVRSEAFKRMFKINCVANNENKIVITGFDYETVEAAVALCYDQNVDIDISRGIELLRFFDNYLMHDLKKSIELELIPEINVLTVCKLATVSVLFKAAALEQSCVAFLEKCLNENVMVSNITELHERLTRKGFDLFSFSYKS